MTDVLVLCDSPWHPAEVIEMGFKPLEGDEFHFVFVKAAKDILTPERIAAYPLIVCCKGDNISEANNAPWFEDGVTEVGPKEFEDYIRAGGGFLAVHAGTLGKRGEPYAELVGFEFKGHPPRCGVDVKITSNHEIVEGIPDFHIRDEHYMTELLVADGEELFRTLSPAGGEQVGGYARRIGEGRLCALTPGHCLDVFYHPEYKKILLSAMRWCMRRGL
jgi:type 1 glutamine amidotransferase